MATITQDDINFLAWLDHPDNMHYWSFDTKGDKVVTRHSWDKALEEYNKIKQSVAGLPPAKYRRTLEGCQLYPGNE